MENPYGYMRAADVLLIPSFSEAAPMVIHESALLGTPILTTETSSADGERHGLWLGVPQHASGYHAGAAATAGCTADAADAARGTWRSYV